MTRPTEQALLARAREVLRMEAETVAAQTVCLNKSFLQAVQILCQCTGRIVVLGVGKSGLIGRKIMATLASTGTPAMFVHPSEGMHGDLGMITRRDAVLLLSFSGETEEVKQLLPSLRSMKVPLIAMTGRGTSRLAKAADVLLLLNVKREACPYNLTPTTSTTAMLAYGDALAMTVMHARGFKAEDFARLHPGGILGKRLLWTVQDLMHKGKENPVVRETQSVRDALTVMTKTRLGAASIVNRQGKLVAYFTDGDFRRLAPQDPRILERPIKDIMTAKPHRIRPELSAGDAAEAIKRWHCDNLPVVDDRGRPIGLLDERDLLSEGLL